MNNKPVAWAYLKDGEFWDAIHPDEHAQEEGSYDIPLYTQDQLEEARKLGMQQERALWNLSESTQEIMNTHPVKELTDEEIMEIGREMFKSPRWPSTALDFARAILIKAQEK